MVIVLEIDTLSKSVIIEKMINIILVEKESIFQNFQSNFSYLTLKLGKLFYFFI